LTQDGKRRKLVVLEQGTKDLPMTEFHIKLLSAFPESTYANTLRSLREGVALADDTIRSVPLFDSPVGRDLRGLVRRLGVIHRFHEMCIAGDLPFYTEIRPMRHGSWHWLEIQSDDIIAHAVRTQDSVAFPEDTPNRQDQRYRNQDDLFESDKIVPLLGEMPLYSWLCYGVTRNGGITHACWNMPSAQKDIWLARINMTNHTLGGQDDPVKPESVKLDPKQIMHFKDGVFEFIDREKREKDDKE